MCPWLGACIGLRNRVHFYLFVTALLLDLAALGTFALWSSLSCDALDEHAAPDTSWVCSISPGWCAVVTDSFVRATAHGVRISLASLSSVVGVPLLWFWSCRTRNVAANLTTNERYNQKRYARARCGWVVIAFAFPARGARIVARAAGPQSPRAAMHSRFLAQTLIALTLAPCRAGMRTFRGAMAASITRLTVASGATAASTFARRRTRWALPTRRRSSSTRMPCLPMQTRRQAAGPAGRLSRTTS